MPLKRDMAIHELLLFTMQAIYAMTAQDKQWRASVEIAVTDHATKPDIHEEFLAELRKTTVDTVKQIIQNDDGLKMRVNQVGYLLKATIQNLDLMLRKDAKDSAYQLRNELSR